jgi:hypothetical protein
MLLGNANDFGEAKKCDTMTDLYQLFFHEQ